MRKKMKSERGLLSLEASIALTIFIFLMLFLYSLFVVFEVRNEIGHTLLATANSMSLDVFENDTLGNSGTLGQFIYGIYGNSANGDTDFVDYTRWHSTPTETGADGTEVISAGFSGAIEDRFMAYLTGGNAANADAILTRYHVVGGKDGLDFSGSGISGGNLNLSVKYTIQYEFNVFGLGELTLEQKACSKLWA